MVALSGASVGKCGTAPGETGLRGDEGFFRCPLRMSGVESGASEFFSRVEF